MRCCGMTPKVIKIHGKHGMNSRMQPNEKTRKAEKVKSNKLKTTSSIPN